jgi:tetratricopeptide (TPR) repeat protein
MTAQAEIEQALRQVVIEPALQVSIPVLASTLAAALNDPSFSSTPQGIAVSDPKIATLLQALSGRNLTAENTVLSFGQNNQFRDVTIRDVINGNSTTVTFNVYPTIFTLHPVFWIGISVVVLLLLLFGAVVAGANVSGFRQTLEGVGWLPTATPTEDPLAFPPEQPGETLLVIATFRYTEGNRNTVAQEEIRRAIGEVRKTTDVPNLRVEIAPVVLAADDRDGAAQLGARYNASIVVWGEDTGARVTVNFLNCREPTFNASHVTINETERVQMDVIHPDAYISFINHDLPQQMTFLALFAVGQAAYVREDYPTATQVIRRALDTVQGITPLADGSVDADIRQGIVQAFFRLGWLYQEPVYDNQRAMEAYTQAITLDPAYAIAYNNRGIARFAQGDVAGAIADYTQAITLEPAYAAAYHNRGIARSAQDDVAGAIADYTQAITLDPAYAVAYYNRGVNRKAQGDVAGAIADYTQVITLDPAYAAAYYNRGNARSAQGDVAGAIADYTQAITLDPKNAAAYTNRGVDRKAQGDVAGAIADFTQAITLDPKSAAYYNNRGIARHAQGDVAGAIADYTQAITLDPKNAAAYYNRGLIYQQRNERDAAIADFRKARDLFTDPNYKQRVIDFLKELGAE